MSKTLTLLLTLLFILFPEEIKKGAAAGINNGIFILMPAIFPYITVSQIFLKTGAADVVSEFTYKFTKKIFRFSPSFSSAYLISLFCGYPTGSRLACELENCGKKESLRLFTFGNVPGFGFCVSFLGSLTGSTKTGVCIYLCFIFASLILNFIFSFFLNEETSKTEAAKEYMNFSEALTVSVKESSLAMLGIIGFAIFFSGISEMAGKFIKGEQFRAVFCAFCEITAGIPKITDTFGMNIPMIIFFTGFSGLSVIFQSLSFKKSGSPVFFLLTARIIFALTAAAIYSVLIYL